MIVDCHAHVFQHWQGARGHPSTAVHLKYLRKVVTRPAARAFRARDGKEYPQKFTALLNVDEATADRTETLAEVDRTVETLCLRGLYYAQDLPRHGYARNVDHDDSRPFWDRIVAYRLPVFIELSSTPTQDRAGCAFLNAGEKDQILGSNAAELLRIH